MKLKQFFIMAALAVILACPAYAQSSGGGSSGSGASSGSSGGIGNTGNTASGTNAGTSTGGNVGTSPTGVGTPRSAGSGTGMPATSIPSNMSAQDFNGFVRGRWDRDGNGLISQTEWGNVGVNWYGTDRTEPFSTYDTNASGALETSELNSAISSSRLYQRYDLNNDGVIDRSEEARIPRQ